MEELEAGAAGGVGLASPTAFLELTVVVTTTLLAPAQFKQFCLGSKKGPRQRWVLGSGVDLSQLGLFLCKKERYSVSLQGWVTTTLKQQD